MNSGEVSKATGVSQRMIRHYESIGLMPRPDRRDKGGSQNSEKIVR